MSGRCLPPDVDQLQRISEDLWQQHQQSLSSSQALSKLRELAAQLRLYRVQRRNKSPLTESLDDPQLHAGAITASENDTRQMQREFLQRYHELFRDCLAIASERALRERCRRQPQRAAQLLDALYRFHVRGENMTEIAASIGLQAQYQVSRLLKLKQLRATISQYALELLSDRVTELAQAYSDAECLQALYSTIQEALAAELTEIINEAASEAEVKQRQPPPRSLFARSLCDCLERLRAERAS
ncbi:MAG: hypothetical protein HC910_09600 [Spirulinaceae cyanobacterium SM2_1_0]|nr:hypothetical protein [Spirulinaceae cyanobacterium SM2_1_0]